MKRAIAGAAVAAMALIVTGCNTDTTVKSDNGQTVSDKDYAAFDVCKNFVKDRLKSPGSAKWRDPFGDQVTYSGSGSGPYIVNASVDSQNGFGALLRSTYVCTVSNTGGDNWHLDNLDVKDGGDTGN